MKLLVLLALMTALGACAACSCMLSHPQHQYCRADYVVVAKVRSSAANGTVVALRVHIDKELKMNEKAVRALRHGTIYTAVDDGLCGVNLRRDAKYLLAGRVMGDQRAWIGTCDTHAEWASLSAKQKKGFRRLYANGCECKVVSCPWWGRDKCSVGANSCPWTTAYESSRLDCEGGQSMCTRHSNGRCQWNRSRAYRSCVKASREHRERASRLEP